MYPVRIFGILIFWISAGFSSGASTVNFPEPVNQAITNYLESVWGAGDVLWIPRSSRIATNLTVNSEIEVVPCGKPRGSTLLNLDLKRNGILLRRLPVSIRVIAFDWVPVADMDLGRHRTIDPDMFRWERREVTGVKNNWPETIEELTGDEWWTKRLIRQGDILGFDRIEIRPAVVRGDRVKLVAETGGVLIKTDGMALGNGGIGDRIKVENFINGVRLRGTVLERGTVIAEGVDRRKTRKIK